MDSLNIQLTTQYETASMTQDVPITEVKGINLGQLQKLWDHGLDSSSGTARPDKPFSQSEWVFICVDLIVKTARSIQMVLSTGDDEIVESGPVHDFFFHNDQFDFDTFLGRTIGFLAMFREVYWIFPELDRNKPAAIIVESPQRITPQIQNGVVIGYRWCLPGGQQIPLFLEDVHPIIDFNPDSPFRGVGPVTAGELSISSSRHAALLNESAMANGGILGNLITVPGKVDADERRALIAGWESRHRGARNAGKVGLLSGGADVKAMGQSFVDLQMIKLREFDATAILALFGVPREVANLNPEAQYAHGPATQRFISYTIASHLSLIASQINSGILHRFRFQKHRGVSPDQAKSFCSRNTVLKNRQSFRSAKIKSMQSNQQLFAWFAVEDHPALQEMLRERAEKIKSLIEVGVPLNQAIDAYDLPFEHVPWGDDWWVSMGLVPAREVLDGGFNALNPSLPEGKTVDDEDEPTPGDEEGKAELPTTMPADLKIKKAESAQQKWRVWKNWIASWAGIEREYQSSIRKFFLRQERILKTQLEKAMADLGEKAALNNSVKDAAADEIIARVVFDLKHEDGKIKVIHRSFFAKASELGIRQSLTETSGLTDQAFTDAVEQTQTRVDLARKRVISGEQITKINKTTQDKIARQLRAGLDQGESVSELSQRISKSLGGNRKRALSIARDQTAKAVSSGRHEGMKHAGVTGKRWITSGDAQVRDAHVAAGSQYAKAIPLETPFIVGGEQLMHPSDPNGSIGNTIHCRCLQIAAKLVSKKILTINDYLKMNFYSYANMQRDLKDNKGAEPCQKKL